MVRSFDRRIESLFLVIDQECKKEIIHILHYNLLDNANSFNMIENGSYIMSNIDSTNRALDCQKLFFNSHKEIKDISLF